MLRAGLCDLGTCDLEIGCRPVHHARPAGTSCGSSARSRTVSPAGKRGQPGACSPGPPPGVRSAAGCRSPHVPAGRPVTCGVTAWQAMACRICARRALCVSRMAAASFRPGACFSARRPWHFPPRGRHAFPYKCRSVSPRVPRRFRRVRRRFPAKRAPAAACPCPAVPGGPAPVPAAHLAGV